MKMAQQIQQPIEFDSEGQQREQIPLERLYSDEELEDRRKMRALFHSVS